MNKNNIICRFWHNRILTLHMLDILIWLSIVFFESFFFKYIIWAVASYFSSISVWDMGSGCNAWTTSSSLVSLTAKKTRT